ncbi:hypothetical protein EVAR_52938_1 [Eumeta japonica]|uniref:Protein TsetseEP domain-containing protein n=1 Tax=Eumeta variegata TaxID=151549 RepID=A0A4C1XRM2_EUMVA|nr:hypothetical protein EVAR_52938_1 [Eumeta japonica]
MNFAAVSLTILVFAACQDVTSQKPNTERVSLNYFPDENFASLLLEYEARFGIWDLWQSIKDVMTTFWDFIKKCVNTTIEFIKECARAVQEKTKDLLQKAEERLVQLRQELQETLQKWAEKSEEIREVVALCYEEQKEQIQEIFANSLLGVHQCIDRALGDVTRVESAALQRAENTNDYMEKLRESLENCKNAPDVEECLARVKDEIEKEGTIAEDDHIKNREETKSIIDDILEEVSKCVTQELLKTANILAKKVVIIGLFMKTKNKAVAEKPK